jgi:hypothetical protein
MAALFFKIKKLPLVFKDYKNYAVCYFTAISGAIFLFYNAADVRFGAGIFTVSAILIFLPALIGLMEKFTHYLLLSKVYSAMLIIFMIVFEAFLFNRYFYKSRDFLMYKDNISEIKNRIVMPADYGKSPSGVTGYTIGNGVRFFMPDIITAPCWYDPFPCTAETNIGLELRGDGLEYGFRIKSGGESSN